MYCIVLSIRLFSKGEWMWCFSFRNLQACGYQVPPSVDTACFPWVLTRPATNLSATNMFLSLDTVNARIALSFGSIATQSQTYSEPALIIVSSIINSATFFLFDDIFWG